MNHPPHHHNRCYKLFPNGWFIIVLTTLVNSVPVWSRLTISERGLSGSWLTWLTGCPLAILGLGQTSLGSLIPLILEVKIDASPKLFNVLSWFVWAAIVNPGNKPTELDPKAWSSALENCRKDVLFQGPSGFKKRSDPFRKGLDFELRQRAETRRGMQGCEFSFSSLASLSDRLAEPQRV